MVPITYLIGGCMAKYISINELDKFHFHDACFRDIEINNENMIWKLEFVNVTTTNSQNNLDVDMEAGILFLTFKNWKVKKIEYYGFESRDEHWNIIGQQPNIVAPKEDYLEILLTIGKQNGVISYVEDNYDNQNEIKLCSIDFSNPDVLNIELEYSDTQAEWENYTSKAWYIR
jgi:hypothetical protein